MNEVIQTLLSHRSFRSFENKPVDEEQLDQIIQAVQAAPNWINGQQLSIIAIKDTERKKRFAELCGGQKHVEEAAVFLIFCADFYRTHLASEMEGMPMEAIEDIDTLIVGVTDVGIALGTAVAAAESFGLGTVPIGGIRRHSLEVVKELALPPYVIPITGLCIGHPGKDTGQKPRLPKEAVYHENTYQQEQKPLLEKYNDDYANYLVERSGAQRAGTWTKTVASFYRQPYYEGIADMLKQQKFPGGKE
ncbi:MULTISPECIES: NADPH-dependent oxidoreductase [Bacillaceae]|uniref:NADPH-dependent oxidoreductase n=1 Tax=Bacillaceae TaxID=186817 RepID=UPI000E7628F2|nr:NADPH-dependent oxidoreductase [Bacillus sp. PK3_68]RJS62514.1 NADPH-dependent oxidoreductase [Bacillus sp. PK3_68]